MLNEKMVKQHMVNENILQNVPLKLRRGMTMLFIPGSTTTKILVSIIHQKFRCVMENPHQSAAFYGKLHDVFEKLHGKDISYNNLVDIESCVYLIEEFQATAKAGLSTFAIIKHTNACGLATSKSRRGLG